MASVLIIDDSPTEQIGLSQILQRYGHSCFFANTGASGIDAAKKGKPDLILMDVVMPETNGFQATRKISTDPDTKHIPIIILSTKNQPTDRVWGLRQGAREYLCKPVNEAELINTINGLLKP